jgi:hypothetical protein
MDQIMRELKRHIAGDSLGPEQFKGLIRAGYVHKNGDDHILTHKGRDALARAGVVTPTGEAESEISRGIPEGGKCPS